MKAAGAGLVVALALVGLPKAVWSHCEMPCGIYGDELRFEMLSEHIATLEKSMQEIGTLSAKTHRTALEENQLVRWVVTKEDHADKLQEVVSHYFLHQRIKPVATGDKDYPRYIQQLTAAHRLMIGAMKAKQTVDLAQIGGLRADLEALRSAYLGPGHKPHVH